MEPRAAAELTKRVLDGIEEANGIDSGCMSRQLELEDVFVMKTSLLSRLRMQREDAAHADTMAKCRAVLSRTKELGALMEQVCVIQPLFSPARIHVLSRSPPWASPLTRAF
jgi:hypothetical protein